MRRGGDLFTRPALDLLAELSKTDGSADQLTAARWAGSASLPCRPRALLLPACTSSDSPHAAETPGVNCSQTCLRSYTWELRPPVPIRTPLLRNQHWEMQRMHHGYRT